jgi:hypothetical protein
MPILKLKLSHRFRKIAGFGVLALLFRGTCTCCLADEYRPYLGMRAAQMQPPADDESLPAPSDSTAAVSRKDCQPLVDDPQAVLTVDIYPINRPGQTDLDLNSLPEECPAPVLAGAGPIYLGFQPMSGSNWPVWPGAQFCHHPLYFEEPCLERYGCTSCCCQPAASAAHFFGSVLLLPIKMCAQCPGRCVCTPPAF